MWRDGPDGIVWGPMGPRQSVGGGMVVLSSMRRKAGGDRCRRDRPQVVHAPRAALACVGSTPAIPRSRSAREGRPRCRVPSARSRGACPSDSYHRLVPKYRRGHRAFAVCSETPWTGVRGTSRSWRATVRMLDGLADHMEGRSLQRCVVTVTDKALGGRRVEEVPQGRAVGHPGLAFNPFAAETVWRGKTLYPSHDKASRGLRAAVGNVRAGYLSLSGTRGG